MKEARIKRKKVLSLKERIAWIVRKKYLLWVLMAWIRK